MRRTCFALGVAALALLWWGPLPQLARSVFSAHMTMHMGVVAVAAPLLALGLAGSRFDPVRLVPRLFAPIPASILELLVVWAWHAPGLHYTARQDLLALTVEQSMFLFSGLLVWLSAFGGRQPRSAGRSAAGIVGLLLTSMHMTLLGALLALTPRPLYELDRRTAELAQFNQVVFGDFLCRSPAAYDGSLSALSPIVDQHLGGAIMLLVGGISYLLGGLWLTVALLRAPVATEEERK